MASNANKRARRTKRREPEEEPEFQVAPMIDVLLVLTLFFMSITSTELLKKDKNLVLPDANQAKKDEHKQHPGQIVINISWNHIDQTAGFSIDGKMFPDAGSMTGYLSPKVAADPRSYALIRADKDVQYSNVADAMSACGGAGISKVSFAVITGGKKATAAAAPAAGGK